MISTPGADIALGRLKVTSWLDVFGRMMHSTSHIPHEQLNAGICILIVLHSLRRRRDGLMGELLGWVQPLVPISMLTFRLWRGARGNPGC